VTVGQFDLGGQIDRKRAPLGKNDSPKYYCAHCDWPDHLQSLCGANANFEVPATGWIIIALLAELLTKLENPPVRWSDLVGQADGSKERLEKSDCPNCGRTLSA
jgi:hypothetical protein